MIVVLDFTKQLLPDLSNVPGEPGYVLPEFNDDGAIVKVGEKRKERRSGHKSAKAKGSNSRSRTAQNRKGSFGTMPPLTGSFMIKLS